MASYNKKIKEEIIIMIKLLKKKLNKRGFTLIELIVVIAIVAVLAVIGIPAIAGQVAKAQLATAESNAKAIASQAQIWITEDEVNSGVAGYSKHFTIIAVGEVVVSDALLQASGITKSKINSAATKITFGGSATVGWSVDKVVCKIGDQTGTFTRV